MRRGGDRPGVVIWLAFATLLGCAADAAPPRTEDRAATVILVSLDGVRHDAPDRADFPGLARLEREGLRAGRLVPVTPASTFPGHVSLATGTHPDVHGIVDNRFWDRERGTFDYSNDASWIEAEPLWAAAERQGVPSATFFWVGSESDWQGIGVQHRRAPFDTGVGEAEKVAQVLAWLDLPAPQRPRLVMTWWHGADRAGHRRGPDHPDVVRALAAQDEHLQALLAGLDARNAWEHTTLIIVSDHGMTTAEHSIRLKARLRDAGIEARLELGSAVAHLFFDDASHLEPAEQALAGLEGLRSYRRDDLPRALRLAHPRRSGDLVLLAQPHYTFRSGGLLARLGDALGQRRGLHGYGPEHPDMAAIFYAMGRGVPPGTRLERLHMIDVAPSIAALLGIDPPRHSEGVPLPAWRH